MENLEAFWAIPEVFRLQVIIMLNVECV